MWCGSAVAHGQLAGAMREQPPLTPPSSCQAVIVQPRTAVTASMALWAVRPAPDLACSSSSRRASWSGSREANDDDSGASPTPPPTRQLTSYHAWSHHRPVSTDQKVQGSNPFGRTSSGAHSSVALSVILTRLGWVIRCPGLSAQEHIDSDQLGRFESSRIVSPRPGLTNAARCSCSPQCRARSQCGSCGNSGHSDSPTAHFRRPVCQAPATGRVSGALQGARQRANAGPAPCVLQDFSRPELSRRCHNSRETLWFQLVHVEIVCAGHRGFRSAVGHRGTAPRGL